MADRSPIIEVIALGVAIRAERRIMGVMDVELFVGRECPNEAIAAQLLRTALDDIGGPDRSSTPLWFGASATRSGEG